MLIKKGKLIKRMKKVVGDYGVCLTEIKSINSIFFKFYLKFHEKERKYRNCQ